MLSKWKVHPITVLQIVAVVLSFSIGTSVCGFKKVRHTYQEFAKVFPQCRADKYRFYQDRLMLDTKSQESGQILYVIRNVGNRTLYLEHTSQNSPDKEQWKSHLAPQHITAFAMDRDQFQLNCYIKERGVLSTKKNYKAVTCQIHLTVCTVPTADFVAGSKGTYWIAENFQSPERFAKRLHKRGIYW